MNPDRRLVFENAYGPAGDWAQLFSKASGFIGLELLKEDGRYLTIDRWESAQHFEAFKAARERDYAALDQRLEGLALGEKYVGSFVQVGA